MGAVQLTFDLPARHAMGREDFFVAPCNEEAVAWVDKWPDWPTPCLVLYGPEGAGKTHLARVWQHQTDALWGSGESPERILAALGSGRAVALDINGAVEDETWLFHAYNWAKEHKGTLLLTATRPPQDWLLGLPDLKSRLSGSPAASLEQPDDLLITMMIAKLFHDRQLLVSEGVVTYLSRRLDRSFAAIRSAVDMLDDAALERQRALTVPFVKQVLGL